MTTLSIVIPAYNEEANLSRAVEQVIEVSPGLKIDTEILVVNDGSQDRTGEIARELVNKYRSVKLVEHYPNRGYGGALRAGFAACSGELIAFFPADNQFNFAEIEILLRNINHAAIVSGYRVERQDSLVRKINAFGWNSLVSILFGYLCRDIDCGFKIMRRTVLEKVVLNSNGAMIDTELLAGAKARGFRIAEVPLTHFSRTEGRATGSNPAVILRAFRDLISFRILLWKELRAERRKLRSGKATSSS